jgi:hypothetical protein
MLKDTRCDNAMECGRLSGCILNLTRLETSRQVLSLCDSSRLLCVRSFQLREDGSSIANMNGRCLIPR